jgi:soluble calcium-activated nucleotidase 1
VLEKRPFPTPDRFFVLVVLESLRPHCCCCWSHRIHLFHSLLYFSAIIQRRASKSVSFLSDSHAESEKEDPTIQRKVSSTSAPASLTQNSSRNSFSDVELLGPTKEKSTRPVVTIEADPNSGNRLKSKSSLLSVSMSSSSSSKSSSPTGRTPVRSESRAYPPVRHSTMLSNLQLLARQNSRIVGGFLAAIVVTALLVSTASDTDSATGRFRSVGISSSDAANAANAAMHWGGAVREGYFSVADSVVSETEIRFGAVTDLDELSRVKDSKKPKFRSIFLPGRLLKKSNANTPTSKMYDIVLDDAHKRTLFTAHNEAGRGGEFSELQVYNNRLLTFDDRTGDVFEILNDGSGTGSHVVPRFVITEGSGESDKGMKWEWATVKDGELIMGSMGKEYTRSDGSILNRNNLWIAGLNARGELRRQDWTNQYDVVRQALNARSPGYLIIEAVNWSPILQKWVFLPRRISSEMYDENKDERMGGNKLVLVDENFTSASVVEIKMQSLDPAQDALKGFSTFSFVPGTGDRHALAVRSVEEDCVGGDDSVCKQRSYFIVFDVLTGEVLSDEVSPVDKAKFEGVEFVNMFAVPK